MKKIVVECVKHETTLKLHDDVTDAPFDTVRSTMDTEFELEESKVYCPVDSECTITNWQFRLADLWM